MWGMSLIDQTNEASARQTIGGLTKVVTNIVALRNVSGPSLSDSVQTLYGATFQDGLGMTYIWNPTDVSGDNGSTIIKPYVGPATGRWNQLIVAGGGEAFSSITVGPGAGTFNGPLIANDGATIAPQLTVNGGTVVANAPAVVINQTWNNGAVVFQGLMVNIVMTAAGAASKLMDLQVAGVSAFSVQFGGPAGITTPHIRCDGTNMVVDCGSGQLFLNADSGSQIQFNGVVVANNPVYFIGTVGFNNTAPIAKPAVTGSKAGNVALANLMTALANYGLVTDSTT
jgi:hypothetical protein